MSAQQFFPDKPWPDGVYHNISGYRVQLASNIGTVIAGDWVVREDEGVRIVEGDSVEARGLADAPDS